MKNVLRKIIPYKPGFQPEDAHCLKLNANENPYPPSPKVLEALADFDATQLRYYSQVGQPVLRQALAEHHGVSPDQIIVGNGSDEILSFSFLSFFCSEQPVLFPDLTYGFYKVLASLYNIPYQEVPLAEDFTVNTADYLVPNGGIVLANPNAPTGYYKPIDEIERIVAANPDVVVVVDEAYIDFSQTSALSLLDKYPNVFVIRTFSKSASLAGLRVGYGIGRPELIGVMNAVKDSVNPYNLDSIAEYLAIAAIKDWAYYETTIEQIGETREWFTQALTALGFEVLKSETSFVLVKPKGIAAANLEAALAEEGIYIRYYPNVTRIKDYVRIAIGTQADMERVISAIKALLRA